MIPLGVWYKISQTGPKFIYEYVISISFTLTREDKNTKISNHWPPKSYQRPIKPSSHRKKKSDTYLKSKDLNGSRNKKKNYFYYNLVLAKKGNIRTMTKLCDLDIFIITELRPTFLTRFPPTNFPNYENLL